jgi:hypothetical protein
MKNKLLPFLIAFSALSISATAAYYSVTGLSMLFAGASFAVLVMASSLEISKLVIASLLYQYWDKLNKILRTYLTIATIVLILITSAGIYGFLSSAYQSVATQSEIVDKQIAALESKKVLYEETRDNLLTDRKSNNELKGALSKNSITQYTDKNGNLVIRNNNAAIKNIESTSKENEKLASKIDVVNDSIFSLENQILEVKVNSEASSELGPLKYLSGLTGQPMDKIINWFLLIIIFVFDPLAISLVIAANFAFNQVSKKKPYQLTEEDKEWLEAPLVNDEILYEEPNENLKQAAKTYQQKNNLDLDINGDGIVDENEFREGFNKLDLDGDGIIDENESNVAGIDHQQSQKLNQISQALNEIENIHKGNHLSSWKKNKVAQEIDKVKKLLLTNLNKDDENTIRYF